uniref:Tudor domain-containing protein n=1 Tax=Amphimedon queenslandica TaxID=400682 RepID=A0A1X7T6L7_AMPQE
MLQRHFELIVINPLINRQEWVKPEKVEAYKSRGHHIVLGPCCARFNNDGYWYRATILEHSQPDVVQIRYVDYGNNDFVPLNAIRQPKPHYLALPAQCIECRLANICPPGSTWSKRACRILVEMTKDKAIAAMATSTKVRQSIWDIVLNRFGVG